MFVPSKGYLGRGLGGDLSLTSSTRPGGCLGNGRGGDGSWNSSTRPGGYLGKGRGGEGSWNSSTRPGGYLGKGLGGEGSCETGSWVEVELGAGRAMHPVMQRASTGARVETFIVTLCGVKDVRLGM